MGKWALHTMGLELTGNNGKNIISWAVFVKFWVGSGCFFYFVSFSPAPTCFFLFFCFFFFFLPSCERFLELNNKKQLVFIKEKRKNIWHAWSPLACEITKTHYFSMVVSRPASTQEKRTGKMPSPEQFNLFDTSYW